MATAITAYASHFAQIESKNRNFNDHTSARITKEADADGAKDILLSGFSENLGQNKYKKLLGIELYIYTDPSEDKYGYKGTSAFAYPLLSNFDQNTVTYSDKPEASGTYTGRLFISGEQSGYHKLEGTGSTVYDLKEVKYGIWLRLTEGAVYTPESNYKPYYVLYLEDPTIKANVYPESGYTKKSKAFNVSWTISAEGTIDRIEPASTILRYRNAGATSWKQISTTSTSAQIPSEDVTGDEIEYYVTVTTNSGNTVTSDTCKRSTVEALPVSKAIYPDRTVIDGSESVIFKWEHIISTGSEQTKAELQYSIDGGQSYNDLANVTGAGKTYSATPNTFTSGNVLWRVRTFNTDNNPGEWSDAAQMTVISAPAAPSVDADITPRPVIRWQSSGQQAYQIAVDSKEIGTFFGTENRRKLPVYLENGEHSIKVRVQNLYGLWSEWGEFRFKLERSTQPDILLSAEELGAGISISWTTSGTAAYNEFVVMKNGEYIGRTENKFFQDDFAGREEKYCVLGIYSDRDDFGKSNEIKAMCIPKALAIKEEDGEWMLLRYYHSAYRETETDISRDGTFLNCYGADKPVLEMARIKSKSMSFEASFDNDDEAISFEEMIGKKVIVKDEQGNAFYGVILNANKKKTQFYVTFECSIRDTYRKEVIDLDSDG